MQGDTITQVGVELDPTGATAALQAPSTEVSASAARTGKRQLDTAILRAALR
jgi:hypothetical protein